MSLVLSWLSFKGAPAPYKKSEELVGENTIGRLESNDFYLPDPQRITSRNHAKLYEVDNRWFIVDTSSTSTVINDMITLRNGEQYMLTEGDTIAIGESILRVDAIIEPRLKPVEMPSTTAAPATVTPQNYAPQQETPQPQADDPLVFNIDDFFESAEPAETIDNNYHQPAYAEPSAASITPPNPDFVAPSQPPPVTPSVAPSNNADISQDAIALRAFLKELDLEPRHLVGQNKVEVLKMAGTVLRTLTEGMMGVLNARALMKEKLELDQTQIQLEKNNAFKFAQSPQDALAKMLTQEEGYMDPVSAANEAVEDAKAHQLAMISGLNVAVQHTIESFDPKALEEEFEIGFSFSKKAKYWDIYCEVYERIAENAQSDSSNIFITNFKEHYRMQIEKLRK